MKSCIFCVEKHLGKAKVYFDEAIAGYPGRITMALGELAAAEEEARDWAWLVGTIREYRKALEVERQRCPLNWEGLFKDIEPLIALAKPEDRKMTLNDTGITSKVLNDTGSTIIDQAAPRPPHTGSGRVPRSGSNRDDCPDCPGNRRYRLGTPHGTPHVQPTPITSDPAPAKPLLVLMTALTDFDPSYSLVSVILDQARAGVMAGFDVELVGMQNMTQKRPEIQGVSYVPLWPSVAWKEDQIDLADSTKLRDSLATYCDTLPEGATIITHDLVFQSWYATMAHAIHMYALHIPPRLSRGHQWIHQIHSSVGPRPPEEIAEWRAKLPEGHRLAIVNWSDHQAVANYYQCEQDRIVTIPNTKDPMSWGSMTAQAAKIITATQLADAVWSQVYPLSLPRAIPKGALHVVRVFGALKSRVGWRGPVRLIFACAHCNGEEAKQARAEIERVARSVDLEVGVDVVFTQDIIPETANVGISAQSVKELMQYTSLFCFPSSSESCGLVALEAAVTGNLLVLNNSLPVMHDFFGPPDAIWVTWGSIHASTAPDDADHIAERIYDVASQGPGRGTRRHILRTRGLASLVPVLEGLRGP